MNSRRNAAGLSLISKKETEVLYRNVLENISNRFVLSNGKPISITQLDGGAYRRVLNNVFEPFLPQTDDSKKRPLFYRMGSTDFESDSKTIRNNELFYEYYFSKVTGELNQTLII